MSDTDYLVAQYIALTTIQSLLSGKDCWTDISKCSSINEFLPLDCYSDPDWAEFDLIATKITVSQLSYRLQRPPEQSITKIQKLATTINLETKDQEVSHSTRNHLWKQDQNKAKYFSNISPFCYKSRLRTAFRLYSAQNICIISC